VVDSSRACAQAHFILHNQPQLLPKMIPHSISNLASHFLLPVFVTYHITSTIINMMPGLMKRSARQALRCMLTLFGCLIGARLHPKGVPGDLLDCCNASSAAGWQSALAQLQASTLGTWPHSTYHGWLFLHKKQSCLSCFCQAATKRATSSSSSGLLGAQSLL
jgi:hypothetical protein